MKNSIFKNSRLAWKILAITLLAIGIVSFMVGDIIFIQVILAEIVVLPWILSKGKWEKKVNEKNATTWRSSKIFAIYLVLFILHSFFGSFYLVDVVGIPRIEREFPRFYIIAGFDLMVFIIINVIFIIICIRKRAPKQILSIPLIEFIRYTIPITLSKLGLFYLALESYFLAVLPLLQIIWALYVRFVFLGSKNSTMTNVVRKVKQK